MNYLHFTFTLAPDSTPDSLDWAAPLLAQQLADRGFESFETTDEGRSLHAFVAENNLSGDAPLSATTGTVENYGTIWHYTSALIPSDDWLKKWREETFTPIAIEHKLLITTPEQAPTDQEFDHQVLIRSYNSFGSGEHDTTRMMLEALLRQPPHDCSVVDMGCGTGILGIVALQLGAKSLTGIDISADCVQNSLDNLQLNGYTAIPPRITILHGDAHSLDDLAEAPVDLLLANIHRNIIIADLPRYLRVLKPSGELWVSGFMAEDVPLIVEAAAEHHLVVEEHREHNGWQMLRLRR